MTIVIPVEICVAFAIIGNVLCAKVENICSKCRGKLCSYFMQGRCHFSATECYSSHRRKYQINCPFGAGCKFKDNCWDFHSPNATAIVPTPRIVSTKRGAPRNEPKYRYLYELEDKATLFFKRIEKIDSKSQTVYTPNFTGKTGRTYGNKGKGGGGQYHVTTPRYVYLVLIDGEDYEYHVDITEEVKPALDNKNRKKITSKVLEMWHSEANGLTFNIVGGKITKLSLNQLWNAIPAKK